MLKRCIMIFPEIKNINVINDIRQKYDPLADHVRPHITLVFPFESDIETNVLKDHMEKVMEGIKPFEIALKGITPVKSSNNHLFLNIADGKEKIIEMHKRLYTGILKEFLPEWLKSGNYLPHMTVGNIKDEFEFEAAVNNTKDIIDVFRTTAHKISVENIDENEDSFIEFEIDLNNG